MESDDLRDLIAGRPTMSGAKTPWFVLNSPELGKPFADFQESCQGKSVLDMRTKELLMTALACVFRCQGRMEEHIKGAIEAGATKEELTEALLIAAVEAASSQLAWQDDLCVRHLT